jgi:hypothetical protein
MRLPFLRAEARRLGDDLDGPTGLDNNVEALAAAPAAITNKTRKMIVSIRFLRDKEEFTLQNTIFFGKKAVSGKEF